MTEQLKMSIRSYLKGIPVSTYFVAKIEWETIEWFEDHKWFTLPNDYRWFLRNLGHGGIGFEVLGMERVSERLHIFHAMREAQRLEEFIPLRDFLVLQFLCEGDFFYLQTTHDRQERETAPVFLWVEKEQQGKKVYPNFYAYFLDQLQQAMD